MVAMVCSGRQLISGRHAAQAARATPVPASRPADFPVMRFRRSALMLGLALAFATRPAAAQSLGTLSWQLQPYCNRVSLAITQNGAVYTLDGFDDQCGAPQRAPVVGTAAPNPDGTIGLGFAIVTTPGGRSVHVDAQVSPATGSGTWRDSEGNSGTFALGAASGGSPRRDPTGAPNAGTYIDVSAATLSGPYGFGVLVTGTTPPNGAAIMARWGDAPTLVPSYPGAILGHSRSEAGIVGQSDTAAGVAGMSFSGAGVGGASSSGPGVFGTSVTGPGVRALSSTGAALEVDGGIYVGGATRPAFRHVATPGNISGNWTVLGHPFLDNQPTALVFVTPVYGASFVYVNSPIGVFYAGGTWRIFRQDGSAMPVNAEFNVLVINQ